MKKYVIKYDDILYVFSLYKGKIAGLTPYKKYAKVFCKIRAKLAIKKSKKGALELL